MRGILLAGFLALSGCAGNIPTDEQGNYNTCTSGSAQIGVGDGYLQILCGCSEASGTQVFRGSTLTCSVSSGTQVFFFFLGNFLPHQIVSDGTPSFSNSPYSDPNSEQPIVAHAVQFSTSGTYRFQDALDSTITGQIVVP